MAEDKKGLPVSVIAAVLVLGSAAAIFLIANFGDVGIAASWPVILVAAGLSLALAGYPETGLAIAGAFLIWLLANLDVIPPFSRSWPFILIWIVVLVVFGFLRGRMAGKKTS
jgi:hypothetical protein